MESLQNDDVYYSLTTLRGSLDLMMRLGHFLNFSSFTRMSHALHLNKGLSSTERESGKDAGVHCCFANITQHSGFRLQWSHYSDSLKWAPLLYPTIPPESGSDGIQWQYDGQHVSY